MAFGRGAQDGGNQFWEVPWECPWDTVCCPSVEQLWKWDLRLSWRLFCWSMRGCAAGLWSPGIHQWQAADPGACYAHISFPDPSVRCCTGKYDAHQYLKKNMEHIEAKSVMVGQDEEKCCHSPDTLFNSCLVQGWRPLFIRNIFRQWHCRCSDTNGFLFVHTYFCLDSFCISVL